MGGCAVPIMVAVSEVILHTGTRWLWDASSRAGQGALTLQLVRSDDYPQAWAPIKPGHGDSKRDGWAFWKSLDSLPPPPSQVQEVGEWLSHRWCPSEDPSSVELVSRATSLGSETQSK